LRSIPADEGILDVSPVFAGDVSVISFDRTFALDYSFDDVKAGENVHVTGSVADNSGYMHIDFVLTASYKASCARCLKETDETLRLSQSFPVTTDPEKEEGDSEYVVASKENPSLKAAYSIDLRTLCYECIITSIPSRHLCSENCRGLCPKCGADLNEGECGCSKAEPDPRLSGLSDFFSKKQDVKR